jgi:hypothetical protein
MLPNDVHTCSNLNYHSFLQSYCVCEHHKLQSLCELLLNMRWSTEHHNAYDSAQHSTTHGELACNFAIFISQIYIIPYLWSCY